MSECHFSWQAQHLVMSGCHFSWHAQYLVMSACHFLWQAQYLVKFECHFSWQAQYSVKFGMIAGARNVVIFHTKCVSEARKVTSANGRVRDDEFMLGSCSDHGRIGRAIGIDTSTVLGEFRLAFGVHFCVASAVFGEVGG